MGFVGQPVSARAIDPTSSTEDCDAGEANCFPHQPKSTTRGLVVVSSREIASHGKEAAAIHELAPIGVGAAIGHRVEYSYRRDDGHGNAEPRAVMCIVSTTQ
jgi:hypothetical protein